jgi:hypothetical protein
MPGRLRRVVIDAIGVATQPVFFIFLAFVSKDFLKYASDGNISGNGPRA